jgi:hypothetical protein
MPTNQFLEEEEQETRFLAGHSYLVQHHGRTVQVHILRVTHTSYRYRYERDVLDEWMDIHTFEAEHSFLEDLGNEDEA